MSSNARGPADRPPGSRLGGRAAFGLFAEMLLTGAVLAVVSVPLVTAVPAIAAGACHLRRHLEGWPDSVGDLVRLVGAAIRQLWPVGVAVPVLLLLVGFDLWLVSTGALPGATVVGVVVGVVAAGAVVVVLRLAGAWYPGARPGPAVREAAHRCVQDLTGSVLLLAALGVVATVVWMFRPLLLVAPGLLAFAAVAVEHRRTSGPRP